jgi:hypothetical protein
MPAVYSATLFLGAINNRNLTLKLVGQLSKNNFHGRKGKNWSRVPNGGLKKGEIGRLTVCRKTTLTFISS